MGGRVQAVFPLSPDLLISSGQLMNVNPEEIKMSPLRERADQPSYRGKSLTLDQELELTLRSCLCESIALANSSPQSP